MRATLTFVRQSFDDFNRLIFDGKLPQVRLRLSSSIRTLGTLRHPRKVTPSARPEDFTISISNRLDLDREVIEDTIIHEMIHLHIVWNRIADTSAHGKVFRQTASYINRRHGRHITVSHRGSDEEKTRDRLLKPRIAIISTLNSGQRGITVCCGPYTKAIYHELLRNTLVSSLTVIATYNSLLAHYPSSRTAKIYKIDNERIEAVTQKCIYFEYRDGKLQPINN